MKMRNLVILSALVIMTAAPAWAANTKLSLVGAIPVSKSNTSGNTLDAGVEFKEPWGVGYGAGATFELGFNQYVGIQVGGLYTSRKVSTKLSSTALNATLEEKYTLNQIEIPVALRFWLNRYFVLSAGGFYSLGMGKVKYSSNAVPALALEAVDGSFDYNDSNIELKKNNYGLLGGLGVNLPLSQKVSFIVDGRFQYGLANRNEDPENPNVKVKTMDITTLVGLQFNFGSK